MQFRCIDERRQWYSFPVLKTNKFLWESTFTIAFWSALSSNVMQESITRRRRWDKISTINHFSCYSINSLRHVRMWKETERGGKRKRESTRVKAEKPRCFSFIFYPGDKSRRAPWHAGRFSGKNSWRLTRGRFAHLALLHEPTAAFHRRKTTMSRMHLRKYTNYSLGHASRYPSILLACFHDGIQMRPKRHTVTIVYFLLSESVKCASSRLDWRPDE